MSEVHEIEATVDIGVKVQLNWICMRVVQMFGHCPHSVIAPLGPNNKFHVIF